MIELILIQRGSLYLSAWCVNMKKGIFILKLQTCNLSSSNNQDWYWQFCLLCTFWFLTKIGLILLLFLVYFKTKYRVSRYSQELFSLKCFTDENMEESLEAEFNNLEIGVWRDDWVIKSIYCSAKDLNSVSRTYWVDYSLL